MILASAVGDFFSGAFAFIVMIGLIALLVGAVIWFFRGPAKASDEYVAMLSQQFPEQDALLFRQMYLQKGGKSTVTAWLLTVVLSPTVSYLYQGAWVKAILSFVTLQGFGLWWVISWFTMPLETMAQNKKAADDAMIQLRLMRPNLGGATPPSAVPAHGMDAPATA